MLQFVFELETVEFLLPNAPGIVVSSNLLLQSIEPQFSGSRLCLLLTETLRFNLLSPFSVAGDVVVGSTCCGPTTAFVVLYRLCTNLEPFVPLKNCCST